MYTTKYLHRIRLIKKDAQEKKLWASSKSWRGRTAQFDKFVYIALCNIVIQCGKENIHAAVRPLAELCGIDKKTVSSSLKHLIKIKLIQRTGRAHMEFAHVYRLLSIKRKRTTTIPIDQITPFNHDAFHTRALGKSSCSIIDRLTSQPGLTAIEISDFTGININTVRRKLNKMGTFSMVEKINRKWYICSYDLSEIADHFNVNGISQRRSSRHRNERERYMKLVQRIYDDVEADVDVDN